MPTKGDPRGKHRRADIGSTLGPTLCRLSSANILSAPSFDATVAAFAGGRSPLEIAVGEESAVVVALQPIEMDPVNAHLDFS